MKLFVCIHSSDDVKGNIVHKAYDSPDKLARDHELKWSDFESYEGILGKEYYVRRGKHVLEVREVDFDGIVCHK